MKRVDTILMALPWMFYIHVNAAFQIGGIVNTTSGLLQGKASGLRSNVSAYLGIPYAQPPIGDLRFALPVPFSPFSGVVNATNFSPDCPSNLVPVTEAFLGGPAGEKITSALAQAGDRLDENCLTLNVWTKPQTGDAKKAILFWIYGGGFGTGASATPIYDGSVLADENDVVVVSINYRLNIFGFSGAPGQPPNAGLWDQRLALEWVRDNAEAFGGDPSRITPFGQSAGGASVDFIAYGFPSDPIAHGLIARSGDATTVLGSLSSVLTNWYNVSSTLGCGGSSAGESTVPCVRTKTWQQLLAAIAPLSSDPLVSGFAPVADDIIIPSNLSARGDVGQFAKIPFLTGNTDNEASFFLLNILAYQNLTQAQFNNLLPALAATQPILDLLTLVAFTCPAGVAANYRAQAGVPVWRYRYYGGNYTNTYIVGAGSNYHTSELPVVFGTAESVTGIADSWYEADAAKYMRNAWATFAKNPSSGLSGALGWPQYNKYTVSEVQLSLGPQIVPTFIAGVLTDASCSTVDSFVSLLGQLVANVSSIGLTL